MHTVSRPAALALLNEYTKSESLLKHALSVEAAVRWYARKFGEDEELWGATGLLHDFDYEAYPTPTPEGHPYVGAQILRDNQYPEILIEAILGHAQYTGVERKTLLAKTLFACDELTGLIMASALVRPDKSIQNLELGSIKRKFKDKAFARGVNREEVIQGAQDLSIPLDEHIANVLTAMREIASTLGLA